ncbi:N-acylneuraminate cytidylyltransferase [Paenibacillus camelliae]|uniref:N-acylneuraminate cytidylyltransferase n=1 Tax=Paenibacillus camelliae TaxID=512410 RepID=UPI0020416180|nr:N-acylneuraminate cytidylyltransferase [Paenibacillus camelliae]MCM3635946.1 N-acylneuraminate cytidylyltransferase [Paenibacillus camelliae]
MEKSLRTVAFIPVRGGSKSIPLKNINDFCGKPLVYWTIRAAVTCLEIDEVYVATDSIEIKNVVESFGFDKVKVIGRSAESATDTASTETALLEFATSELFGKVVLIQATSPLLEAIDITSALEKFQEERADSLLTVVRQKRFIWVDSPEGSIATNYNPFKRPRRQEWEGYLVENGALYIMNRESLLSSRCRLSGKISLYEMSEDTYFEIDEPTDWVIAERLKMLRLKKNSKLDSAKIKLLISDVDGVLTDAGMYYSTDGQELKKFNTRDGKGIELVKKAGIKVMLLTAEDIEVVRNRANKLKADYLFMGIKDKKKFLEQFFEQNHEYSFATTAYIGDDVNDLDCLKLVGLSAAPKDAHYSVLREVDYICKTGGGQGCVRELCDHILQVEVKNGLW